MKTILVAITALASSVQAKLVATAQVDSPVAKVLSMLSDLQAKVVGEGEVAQKQYAEFAEWCEDRSSNLGFEIKNGKSQVDTLSSAIAKETSTILSLTTRVEELAAEMSVDQADLKAANHIRDMEQSVFAASEKDLSEIVDMLGRASIIVEREMKGGASMMQLQSARSLGQALGVLVQASLIASADAGKLTAFVQASHQQEDDDVGAPAGAVYASHSGDILNTLQDLRDKAEEQLEAARNKEVTDRHNFEMLRQSLNDEISFGQKEFEEAKRGIAESSEKKSTAEGDLAVTSKGLDEDLKVKSTLHRDCMRKAENFEAETKSRGEELAALAKAKQVIKEATISALSQISFLQRDKLTSGVDLAIFESVRFIRDLARKQHSSALSQLAARMSSAMHAGGGDQFSKIKDLIRGMITKMESEADADASKKAWCDRNLADTLQKKSEKIAETSKLSTKIDQMSAKSAQLKAQVAALQGSLAKLAHSQAEMNKLRSEGNAAYVASRADLEKGLQGLKLALKILTEYYAGSDKAHEAADGAGSGVISLLEVCESDFTQDLARTISDEESAVAEFEKVSNENEIEKNMKNQDISYKTRETKRLDQDSAELSTDRSTVQVELDATQESLNKLEEQCIAKAETYGQRKARFVAEIAGLKEALAILEDETALLQRHSANRKLRGAPAFKG